MSAQQIPADWRFLRARAVVQSGVDIPFAYYAELFDLDEDETKELFRDAAASLGRWIEIGPDPVLH